MIKTTTLYPAIPSNLKAATTVTPSAPGYMRRVGYPRLTALMATTAVIIITYAMVAAPDNDNNPPPKSPAPVAAKKAANDNVPLIKKHTAGRANYMTGPLPNEITLVWVTTSNGKRFQANPKSAPHLKAFIDDLERAGAPISEIGGYNRRHIAGTARWSQHAYGNAVDLNQLGRNRVTPEFDVWAKAHRDKISAAARKHGIINGAEWSNPDFGHFEWGGGGVTRHGNHQPASIRYNNPGAQYPAEWAKAFGMDGRGVIGNGHLIAHFPDPIAGAAANMFLLNKAYVGLTVEAAGAKWTGNNGYGVPGYDPNTLLTHEKLNDPAFIIPFMKAIAKREAGRESPLTNDQWGRAFKAFRAGKYSAVGIGSTSASAGSHEAVQTTSGSELVERRPFFIRKGRLYRATLTLLGVERWAANDTIAERLLRLGFAEVEVRGSGSQREAQGRWTLPDVTSQADKHLSNVIEVD